MISKKAPSQQASKSVEDEAIELLNLLDDEEQASVLDYLKALMQYSNESGPNNIG